MKENLNLRDKWIDPLAVAVSSNLGYQTQLNGPVAVLGDTDIYNTTITGDVIIGGPDCNTTVDTPRIEGSSVEGNGIRIYGNTVINNCQIKGRAQISGSVIIGYMGLKKLSCSVGGDAVIAGNAHIENSQITEHARVSGWTRIYNSTIFGNAQIYGDADVQNSTVGGDARVCGNANISNITLTTCDKQYCSDCP